MPNIKSAKKRVLVIEKKTLENKMIKSSVKTEIKKIESLIKEGKIADAKANLSDAFKIIDMAVSKGVLHKNNAANKKSKLAKKLNVELPKEEAAKEVKPVKEVKAAKEEKPVEEVKAEEPVKKTRTRKPKAE